MRRWPAEWEPQQTVIFSFPRREGDWGNQLEAASRAIIAAVQAVQMACPVTLLVGDPGHFADYRGGFSGTVIELPTDDCWVRDSGPITVFEDNRRRFLDFTFNGWGGKFSATRDNAIPRYLHRLLFSEDDYSRVPLVLEGGAVESDGRGTVLTTSTCLLSRGRNAYRDKFQAETMLQDHLGAERTIWLDHGELLGDDTDAHVDTLARFLDPKTIAYVGPPTDPTDPHFESLSAMRAELRQLASGYDLLELPFAEPVYSTDDGHRLPATYANFLISNGYLFVPTYGLRTDAAALDLLRGRTSYTVVPVPGRPLIEQHGSLHCLCMQIPAIPPL